VAHSAEGVGFQSACYFFLAGAALKATFAFLKLDQAIPAATRESIMKMAQ
jgi:hypothetical protein